MTRKELIKEVRKYNLNEMTSVDSQLSLLPLSALTALIEVANKALVLGKYCKIEMEKFRKEVRNVLEEDKEEL